MAYYRLRVDFGMFGMIEMSFSRSTTGPRCYKIDNRAKMLQKYPLKI